MSSELGRLDPMQGERVCGPVGSRSGGGAWADYEDD